MLANVWLGHHADDLPCAAQPLRVRLHRRDADGLVRAFDDDLRGLGKRRDQRAGRDDAERLCLVRREAAHPLVQHRRDNYVVIAVLCKIFLRQLLKCADCGDVLDQVAALAVADRDVFHALLRRKQRLDDGDRVGNAGAGTSVPVSGPYGSRLMETPISSYRPVNRSTYCQLAMVVSIGTFLQ